MSKTIMTPQDVVNMSAVVLNFNPCTFREIFPIEYYEARTCLGIAFWNDLIETLKSYTNVSVYQSQEYQIGQVVRYKDIYYQAKVLTSNQPETSTDWKVVPRFEGDCASKYNDFFYDFLGPYLAITILAERLPYIWSKVADKGVVEYNGIQYQSVDDKAYTRLLNAIHRDKRKAFGNMEYYLLSLEERECFKNYVGYKKGCDAQPKTKRTITGGYRFA